MLYYFEQCKVLCVFVEGGWLHFSLYKQLEQFESDASKFTAV